MSALDIELSSSATGTPAVVAADQLPVTNSGDLVSLSDTAFQSMLDAFSMHQFGQLGSILAQDGLLSAPVTLSFDQLTFKKTANNAEQVLLNGVSGVIAPGETICVLGAPDSGATLLLDLLSERMQPNVKNGDSMSGSILMNGAGGDDIEAYRRHIGYVPIGDEHLAELTVWETLQFSAMLRGSTQAEEELKHKLMKVVLKVLGIGHVANMLVGSGELRGISGGERRRLSIALELINFPSILFAQQPTNGLDSANALMLVQYCRALAKTAQRSMIMSLVQPSPQLLLQFDKVLLMSKGQIAYFGPSANILPHFLNLGYRLPPFKSWTEFLEEISGQPDLFFRPEQTIKEALSLEGITIQPADVVQHLPEAATKVVTAADALQFASDMYLASENASEVQQKLKNLSIVPAPPVDSIALSVQMYWMMHRQYMLLRRSPSLTFGRVMPTAIFSLIVGSLFYLIGDTQASARTRVGALFFAVAQLVFSAFALVNVVFSQRSIYYMQKKNRYFKPAMFPITFFLADFPITVLNALVYCLIVYPMIGFVNGINSVNFVYFFLMGVLMSATGRAWAFFLASAIPIEAAASVVAPVTTVVFFLFAGYIIPRNSVPIGWRWFHFASFLTYPFRGLVINEFVGRSLVCAASELVPQPYHPLFNVALPNGFGGHQSCSYTSGPAFVLATYDVDCTDSAWAQFGYECIFFSAFTLLAIRAISNIDHSSLAAHLPPLIRELGLRSKRDKQHSEIELEQQKEQKSHQVQMTFENLRYTVMAPGPMNADGSSGAIEEKRILHDVFGVAVPGKMMALMGASGAGKTTLLDVLAGRKSGGTIEGSLLFNGKPRDQYFHRFAGYVEQFDSHLPTSTVREAIRFSADTRLPEETTEQDKNNRVESAIQTLGLSAVADSQIGDPLMGGLTNELRKKITIAVELVMQPGLLFLDEPTTGLDASAALAVMTKVKELSASISVICTIHQPSSTVLALFDDLLMLEPGGRVAYQGPMDQLHQYLESNQLGVCPPDQNVSNFALKLLASKKSAFDLDNKQERASDVFLRSQQFQVVANDIKAASQPHDVNKLKFDSIMANTVGSQFGLLLRRSAQSLYRDGQFLRARLFGALTFALMLGSLNYRMGFDVRDAASRVSILFFSCTTPVYSSGAAIPVVQSKRVLLERERVSQMYHRSIFYLTEFLADLPLTLIQSFVYVIPIYFLGGFRTDDASSHFWIYYACVVCLYLAGLSLANFTGNLMESAPSANLLSTSILTFMLLFVGFIIPYAQIPSGWIWMHYFNVFRYPLFTMITNELDQMKFSCSPQSLIPVFVGAGNVACPTVPDFSNGYCWQSVCPLQNGNQLLNVFSIDVSQLQMNGGLMVVMWVGFRLLGFLAFRYVNHIKR